MRTVVFRMVYDWAVRAGDRGGGACVGGVRRGKGGGARGASSSPAVIRDRKLIGLLGVLSEHSRGCSYDKLNYIY